MTADADSGHGSAVIPALLAALSNPAKASTKDAAREALLSAALERMRALTHRMLAGSAQVRRWVETDDIVQGAMLRLLRALGSVTPNDAQHFIRLVALQVRRELIDLTRRLGNPESFAANHETNTLPDGRQRTEQKNATTDEEPGQLDEWIRFHETVESLSEPERDLFGMVWYVGLSQPEIAAALGCSPRTVRRRWEETKRSFMSAFQGGPPDRGCGDG